MYYFDRQKTTKKRTRVTPKPSANPNFAEIDVPGDVKTYPQGIFLIGALKYYISEVSKFLNRLQIRIQIYSV